MPYKNSSQAKIYAQQWYQKHKEQTIQRSRARYLTQTEQINAQKKEYRANNMEKILAQRRERRRLGLNVVERAWYLRRYHFKKKDINFLLPHNLRKRLHAAVKQNIKSGHTLELLGCSIDFLKSHLAQKFQDGMSWENYGKNGWSIDHIIPCDAFDLRDPEQQKICFHYSNLQPLWVADNSRKKNKYDILSSKI